MVYGLRKDSIPGYPENKIENIINLKVNQKFSPPPPPVFTDFKRYCIGIQRQQSPPKASLGSLGGLEGLGRCPAYCVLYTAY